MITMSLDWREVLWWLQGGMAGSHLRWSVYEEMVNKVWAQASEQERRNMWLIMRRDLGSYWRPDGWNGHSHMQDKGEGPWKIAVGEDYGKPIDIVVDNETDRRVAESRQGFILDETPWMMFRQVLARFDPDNQYIVTMKADSKHARNELIRMGLDKSAKNGSFRIRAYKWRGEYRIDWSRRCAEDAIVKAEHLDIPDTGEM